MPVDLQRRVSDLACAAGGLRALAKALDIDVGYLSRLASGVNNNPGDEILRKLGLRRVVTYERTRGVGGLEK